MKSIKDYFLDVGEIEENSNFLMKKNIGKKKLISLDARGHVLFVNLNVLNWKANIKIMKQFI